MNTAAATNTVETSLYLYPNQNTGVDKIDGAGDEKSEFSELLSEALSELTTNAYTTGYAGLNMTGSDASGFGMMNPGGIPGSLPIPGLNNTIEQAIMKATESGEKNDAMVALLMLMMMMQSSDGQGGEMPMMMQMMASVIGDMQSQDKNALRSDFMYNTGANPYTLDTFDKHVFGNHFPKVTNNAEADLPLEWWRPTTPAIVSTPNDRDPRLYRAVVDQFDVENAERYRPGRAGNTYCNVYAWDVTRAMGAELPYYSDPETGAPREYPDTKGANYNGAKAMDKWLKTYGGDFGWKQVTAEQAQMYANQGKPVVTASADIGHMQVVVPSQDGMFDPVRGVTISQAGRKNNAYAYISGTYGADNLKNKITYWMHD